MSLGAPPAPAQKRGGVLKFAIPSVKPGLDPAHVNTGPEDFYILTGDLVVGDRKLMAGAFHHAERGSQHPVNYSVEGCTLLAVLTTDDPLVVFAMA